MFFPSLFQRTVATALLPVLLFTSVASAQVNLELGDIPPGESVTFKYRAKLNSSSTLPSGLSQISTQGVVRAKGISDSSTDDPDSNSPGDATNTPVTILDSDGDGTPDDIDGCPTSAGKTSPGICGCGTLDSDSNGNQITDCLLNEDLKERIAKAIALVKRLKPNSRLKNKKKKQAQRLAKKELKQVRSDIDSSINSNGSALALTDPSADLPKLNISARKGIGKAMKTGSAKFKKNRKSALKSLRKLNAAIQ